MSFHQQKSIIHNNTNNVKIIYSPHSTSPPPPTVSIHGEYTPINKGHRPSWDEYYMGIAEAVSLRGDCVRARHGAVVVKNHKIVSTGYNGTPPGDARSCGATGECPRALDGSAKHSEGQYDLCWATHAEANALLRASWEDLQGAEIYITGQPCPGCAKLISSSGISVVHHK